MEFRSLVKSALPFVAILEVRDAVSFRIRGGSRGLQAPECSGSRMGLQARVFVSCRWRGMGSNARPAELKGWAWGVATSPRRTGFASMYRTQLTNFSSVRIWLSLKLRIHTSCLLFKRNEKAALDELHRFFQRNIRSGRNQSVEMLRHDDECVQEEFSLAAIVEEGALE